MISRLGFIISAVFLSFSSAASTKLDFKAVQVANVVQLIYSESLMTSYVIDPELIADKRLVSFRYESRQGALRPFLREFLSSLGYGLTSRGGVDFISKLSPDSSGDVFVYRPKFRTATFLTEALSPLMKGRFTLQRSVSAAEGAMTPQDSSAPPGSAAAAVDHESDLLVFSGSPAEVSRLKSALAVTDIPTGEVVVRGAVYEVSTTRSDGTAFSLLASLMKNKLSLTIGGATSLPNAIRLDTPSFDSVFGMLSQDGRFKVLSTPSLRIRSGSKGTFSVGEDVPTLGAVSFTNSGQPVQTVQYRSSGVIFNVQPKVHDEVIELRIDQQISSFAVTSTGVNNSPTLSKRSLTTTVSVPDSGMIVLGGLVDSKDSSMKEGLPFFPRFLRAKSSSSTTSEVLLVLQVQRI